jgi:hypothetical protein
MSQRLILEAAHAPGPPPRTAIIIGGASCREIPLVPLARDVAAVLVTDIDASALAQLESTLSGTGLANNVAYRVEDVSGCTERLLAEANACIESSIMPGQALAALIDMSDNADVTQPPPGATYDLVVASCVVTQLHLRLQHEIVRRFRERFPLDSSILEASSEWVTSMLRLIHRMQDAFFTRVADFMHAASTAYLSATVHVGTLAVQDDGAWECPGWYRMMRHRQLLENIHTAFEPRHGGEWPWLARTPTPTSDGLLYRVQAMIVGKARPMVPPPSKG